MPRPSTSRALRSLPALLRVLMIVPDAQTRVTDLYYQAKLYALFHRHPVSWIGHLACTTPIVAAMLVLGPWLAIQALSPWIPGLGESPVRLVLAAGLAAWYLAMDLLIGLLSLPALGLLVALAEGAAAALGTAAPATAVLVMLLGALGSPDVAAPPTLSRGWRLVFACEIAICLATCGYWLAAPADFLTGLYRLPADGPGGYWLLQQANMVVFCAYVYLYARMLTAPRFDLTSFRHLQEAMALGDVLMLALGLGLGRAVHPDWAPTVRAALGRDAQPFPLPS